MTLQELYKRIDGNYDNVVGRLRSEERIEKFVLLFRKDQSYQECMKGMELGEWKLAFRAVHTLKGVSLNLSFDRMFRISDQLTETLRNSEIERAKELLPEFQSCYETHLKEINAYAEEKSA